MVNLNLLMQQKLHVLLTKTAMLFMMKIVMVLITLDIVIGLEATLKILLALLPPAYMVNIKMS